MSKLIDVSGNRLRPVDDFDRSIWRPEQLVAIDEMLVGDHHRVLPLGGPDAARQARQSVARPDSTLKVKGAFFQHTVPGSAEHVRFDRAMYAQTGTDLTGTFVRYVNAVRPHAPNLAEYSTEHMRLLRAAGGTLISAVATIQNTDSGAQFDALYVPKAWEGLPNHPEVDLQEQAVELAAGYIILGMTGTQHA